MLTTIFVVLLAIVILLVAAWIFLDLDVMGVCAPIIAPAAGACIIYFYGTTVGWAVGLVLLGIGAFALYRAVGRRQQHDESNPLK